MFGRIVDVLSGKPSTVRWRHPRRWPLLGGLGGVPPVHHSLQRGGRAAHADRLAHRQRQAVLDELFRAHHAIAADLSTPARISGRLMKVMLNGTDSLWRLWLGFFASISPRSCRCWCCCRWRSTSTGGWRCCCFALCVVFTC